MNIKEQIQKDFVIAMKAKDEVAKSALSGLKAKITEAEKTGGTSALSDSDVIKVINKAIKQREESQRIYSEAGRVELARKEADEAAVLSKYMPEKMSDAEIESAVREIIANHPRPVLTNPNALVGKTVGEFNKKYVGMADPTDVMNVIKRVVGQ